MKKQYGFEDIFLYILVLYVEWPNKWLLTNKYFFYGEINLTTDIVLLENIEPISGFMFNIPTWYSSASYIIGTGTQFQPCF